MKKSRRSMHIFRIRPGYTLLIALCALLPWPAAADKLEIRIHYLSRVSEPVQPLSLLESVAADQGLSGVRVGLDDSQTTGGFLGHNYELEEIVLEQDADIKTSFRQLRESGADLFVADLALEDLIAINSINDGALVFNIKARDDVLRNSQCHAWMLHLAPSRAMLADALAQYLVWKKWRKLILVTGRHPQDAAFADSMLRAARRFGLDWVQQKSWTAVPGARRTDSGHYSLQQEVPQFSQFREHQVLVVADEADEFGEYLSYRTSRPRPVAGTQGLIATSWHRTQEQWGATQIQRRFEKLAGRPMTERDYAGWAAMRSVAEAVTQTGSNDATELRRFLLSAQFKLAGFKGVPLSFRNWNGQLRQPVLLAAPRMLVSVSPQDGFLHQHSTLDTLGYDKPESDCTQF